MTKSFALDKPKRSEGWAKFQEWNRKWNRILASIFCILCFILLFAIVIVNIIETKEIPMEKSTNTTDVHVQNEDDEAILSVINLENYDVQIYEKSTLNPSCTLKNCTVTCVSGLLEEVNSEIELAIGSESQCTDISIELTDYNSANNRLYKDWYTLSYPVNNLKILASPFQVIDDYAFNSAQFEYTDSIMLGQLLKLKNLTKNVFVGLERVKHVNLDGFPSIVQIEIGVLDPVRRSMESFAIHSMPAQLLIGNLTGNQPLLSKTVDLNYMNFGDSIQKDSFAGLRAVVGLHLQGSAITSLPSGVFDELINIELIHMAKNQLITVPVGIFDVAVPLRIYLSENNFDCICNEGILYLQEFVKMNSEKIIDNITCRSPIELSKKFIQNVQIYCPGDTSTTNWDPNTPDDYSKNTKSELETTFTDSVTNTIESLTTTTPPLNDFFSNCENHSNFHIANYIPPITVEGRSAEFKIIKDSNSDIFVEFIASYYSDVTLLWFTNRTKLDRLMSEEEDSDEIEFEYSNSIEHECADHVKPRVKILNLRENTIYIFCIVDKTDGRVIPFNCAAFRSICDLPSHEIIDSYDDVWLWKGDKIMVISIFSVSLLLAIISGGLIMYCCLKRFPFFVTNKKQRKSSRTELNEREEIIEYHAPPNYITPTPARRSTKLGADCRPNLNNRRFSESSTGSARSYISAVTPSPFDIISFRMQNNKQKLRMSTNKPEATYDEARDNVLYMTKFPDVPPPLPPHPNRRSNQSNLSSNQSTNSTTSSDPLFSISYRVQHDPEQCRTNSYA